MMFGNLSIEYIVVFSVLVGGITFTMNYMEEIVKIWSGNRDDSSDVNHLNSRSCFPYSFASQTVNASPERKSSLHGIKYKRVSMVAEENEDDIEI